MRIFIKRAVALILLLALTILSGCDRDNIKNAAPLNAGVASSRFEPSEHSSEQQIASEELQAESTSSKQSSSYELPFPVNSELEELFSSEEWI